MRAPGKPRTPALIWQLSLGASLLLLWQAGSSAGFLDPFFFSRPTDIALRLGHWIQEREMWLHLATTSCEAMLSFVIGASAGVLLGFAVAVLPEIAVVVGPYIRIANALPRVVLAPIFLLWFGLGIWSKVALGVTVVFFIVFFNTYRGVREVDRVIVDNVRILGASKYQLARHVLLPSALTWVLASLHVSVGMAIIAVVVGEYLGASKGVGYLIAQAEGVFDTTGVFAGTALLSCLVLTVGALVSRLEPRLLRWKVEYTERPGPA